MRLAIYVSDIFVGSPILYYADLGYIWIYYRCLTFVFTFPKLFFFCHFMSFLMQRCIATAVGSVPGRSGPAL